MRPIIRQFRCRRAIFPVMSTILVCVFLVFYISLRSLNQHASIQNLQQPFQLPNAFDGIEQLHPPEPVLLFRNLSVVGPPQPVPPGQQLENQHQQIKPPVIPSPDELRRSQQKGTPITAEEIRGGQPKSRKLARIRDKIREMTKFAWDSYAVKAWGFNELKPVSAAGHQPSVLGSAQMGATIVDAMDTLYIMGLKKEFEAARKYVSKELHFLKSSVVSVFEFTIRYLGSLLTCYTFTRDEVFLNKAIELAQRLLPAFDTPTGIPMSLINLKTSACSVFTWSRDKCSILAEAGTLHMEFKYLSELTGDPIYANKVDRIRQVISSLERSKGMFYNYLDYRKPRWCANVSGLGGLADSFYEYLLKEWIRTDHEDVQGREMYDIGIEALFQNGVFRESEKGHLYVSSFNSGVLSDSMDHLACFAGGMLALGARNKSDVWFHRAVEITRTCTYSYDVSPTHLGPESFTFSSGIEAIPVKDNQKPYMQRPETVESYFYLWRLTKNETYREAAWNVVKALEAYTRTPGGFSGLKTVQSTEPKHDDVQQSYFLAETLKYLYLIFSEDSLLPLDRWVFNSEGHPFPIHHQVSLGDGIWPKI